MDNDVGKSHGLPTFDRDGPAGVIDRVTHLDMVSVAVPLDRDGCLFDPEELTQERAECCWRTAQLPGQDLAQLAHLLATGAVVDEHAQPPTPLGHVCRGVADEHEAAARNI